MEGNLYQDSIAPPPPQPTAPVVPAHHVAPGPPTHHIPHNTHNTDLKMMERKFHCTYCPYTATNVTFLENHLESHKGEKVFQCRFCNYITKHCGNRIVHERRMHLNKKPYKCKYCNYATVQSSTLHKHVSVHHSEMCKFKCTQCKFSCDDDKRYSRHVVKHSTDMFTAGLSDITAAGHNQSYVHSGPSHDHNTRYSENEDHRDIKIEPGFGREEDDDVNLATSDVEIDDTNNDVREENEVNAERSESRSPSETSSPPDTNSNIKINSQPLSRELRPRKSEPKKMTVKVYKCRYCEYSTGFATNRLIHERRHLGKKPYKCKFCDYAATQSTTLKVHMRQRHAQSVEKYHCNLCKFQCVLEDVFMRHLREAHSDTAMVVDPNVTPPEDSVSTIRHSPHTMSDTQLTEDRGDVGAHDIQMTSTPIQQNHFRSVEPTVPVSDYFADFNCFLNQARQETNPEYRVMQQNEGKGASGEGGDNVMYMAQPSGNAANNTESGTQHAVRDEGNGDAYPMSVHRSQNYTSGQSKTHTGRGVIKDTGTQTLLSLHGGDPMTARKGPFICKHCGIIFPDNVLYTIHRGFHGYEKPFKCNMCGYNCGNKYEFASHSHSCMP